MEIGTKKRRKTNKIIYEDHGFIVAEDDKGNTFIIDSIDKDLLNWYWSIDPPGYPRHYTKIYLHREISSRMNGDISFKEIDHENLDKTDARRKNLRLLDHSQNLHNAGPKRKHAKIHSSFKGVHWSKRSKSINGGVWIARVKKNRKIFRGGQFDNENDAAHAVDSLAKQLGLHTYKSNF